MPFRFVPAGEFLSLHLTFPNRLSSQHLSVQPLGEVVHIGVHDGDVKEAEESADDKTEDDDNAQRLIGIQASCREESQWHHGCHRRAGCHQDWSQPFRARPPDGSVARHPLLSVTHDEVKEQNCRRDVHATEDDDRHDGNRGKMQLH